MLSDARAHSNLGTVYLRAGDRSRAIDELKTALQLNPKLVDAHDTIGAAYAMSGQYEDAAGAWKHALEIDPRQFDTMFNLSILYLDLNRRQDAIPYGGGAATKKVASPPRVRASGPLRGPGAWSVRAFFRATLIRSRRLLRSCIPLLLLS
ncbi:MAG: tetratricopeptide repeat protein [Acidobacteria bacterium]|nr:tetratricopeptide repeat protein [Acidobacteriota bacterium]